MTDERIKELARIAMQNAVCAGEPHYIESAIRQAVNEATEQAAVRGRIAQLEGKLVDVEIRARAQGDA